MHSPSSPNSGAPSSGGLRDRAVERLQKTSAEILSLAPPDLKTAIAELSVYHAELEIQNEELRVSRGELEESRSRYFKHFDLAPVGMLRMDNCGMILESNFMAAEMLGIDRNWFASGCVPIFLRIERSSQETFLRHLESATPGAGLQTCELTLICKGLPERVVRMQSVGSAGSGEQGEVFTTLMDVSELHAAQSAVSRMNAELELRVQKRTAQIAAAKARLETALGERSRVERDLRRSRQQFELVVENAGSVIVLLSPQCEILEWNRSAAAIYGCSRAEVLGKLFFDLFPDPVLAAHAARLIRQPGRARGPLCESLAMARDGGWHTLVWHAATIPDGAPGARRLLLTGLDVTEIRLLEREILTVSEREQRRIGQDLHDGLCQALCGVSFLANGLSDALREEANPHLSSALRIAEVTEECVQLARETARGLYPVELGCTGFSAALEQLAGKARHSVSCRYRASGTMPALSDEAAVTLYRVAQEAVANALKHAGASELLIQLRCRRKAIEVSIADDGKGISPESLALKGMGMHIMRARAQAIGATLQVENRSPKGTRVTCTLYLPPL